MLIVVIIFLPQQIICKSRPFYLQFPFAIMKRAHSSEQLHTLSLVKSREMLDRISNKVSMIESNRDNGRLIQSIQTSSKKIQQTLDSRIEENFNQLMHSPTLMPLAPRPDIEKENHLNTSGTALDGAKALMHHYWERNKKQPVDNSHKDTASKTFQSRKSDKLPEIHSYPRDHKIAAYIKIKEKEKELGMGGRQQEPQQDFHISIPISNYKCQNDAKDFLKFQKRYYKRWEEIHSILRALEKFAEHYSLPAITVQTVRVFELIERAQKGERITPHHLLNCCDNAQAISEQNRRQAGIRFFGASGMIRAVTLIQARFRGHAQRLKFKKALKEWRSAKLIQAQFRCFKLHRQLRQRIFQRQIDKLTKFKQLQQTFKENFRKREISTRKRVQIHIPSHNLSEWQKLSAEHFLERQNGELCRIFRIAQRNPLLETHVVYVSPVSLPKELLSYYRKLLQLGTDEPIDHRLTIITPEYDGKCPINMALTQQLYYSSRTLRKIRRLIQGSYAYIVPSTPSNDYVHLCTELNVPLYGGDPQKLLYLQSRAGCKGLQETVGGVQGENSECGVLPYSVDVYTQANLLNELTNLIYRYPFVKRWVLKIDNEGASRGVAYIDISKIVGKQLLQRVSEEIAKASQQKQYREEIYTVLENALVVNREQRIVPIDREAYPSQADFLRYFYTRGGIIEASINNFESDLENSCFTVNLEPDGEWKFVCSYYKITNKNKGVAAYFDGNCIKPPLQINALVQSLKRKQLFGFFTFEFLAICDQQEKTMKRLQNKLSYLNSVDCHLNALSSAHFLKEFISKDSNALFVPLLAHPCLRELRLQTFFHLCRLQNISFDMEKKVGNVFMFLNGLESGCLGIMTFNAHSRQHCYTHTAEVLDFLNSKVKQGSTKDIPDAFFSLKNAVNGHLNRVKKQKNNRSQKMLQP